MKDKGLLTPILIIIDYIAFMIFAITIFYTIWIDNSAWRIPVTAFLISFLSDRLYRFVESMLVYNDVKKTSNTPSSGTDTPKKNSFQERMEQMMKEQQEKRQQKA